MKLYFLLLSLFSLIPSKSAYCCHGIKRAKIELNDQIKEEFPEILDIKSIAAHENLTETLEDMLQVLNGDFQHPSEVLLTLDYVHAISTYVTNDDVEIDHVIPVVSVTNSLAVLLPHPPYESASELSLRELLPLESFTRKLARRYLKLLRDQGEDKQVRVVPIGKVKAFDEERHPKYYETRDEPYSVVLGVLARRQGTKQFYGIAGLLVRFEEI
ncbi:hypothetical protein Ddc_12776 [Ditylenchus destructor]|nr:hypothetical protein Ddc_12776 [Ditylenchus destructor]